MAICTLAGLMAVTNRPAPDLAIGTQHPNLVMLWYRTLGDGRDYIPRRATTRRSCQGSVENRPSAFRRNFSVAGCS
jgi:hypothetical protein